MTFDVALAVTTAFYQFWIPLMTLLFAAWFIKQVVFE